MIGGGPAGLATAIEAASRGAQVELYERRRPPFDKACGEGLMPDGLDRLHAMGIDLRDAPSRPLVGIRYLDAETGRTYVEGRFPRPGAGIRRLVLHQALIQRAEELGVRLSWGSEVRHLEYENDWEATLADGDIVRPDIMVLADGLRSKLAVQAGLRKPYTKLRGFRFGARRHYGAEPWSDHVEVYWAEGCEAYITPTGPRELGVAVLWDRRQVPPRQAGFASLLERFPTLKRRLADAEPVSRVLGTGPLLQPVFSVEQNGLILSGDASGYVDAITGEGLSIAFHQAAALGEWVTTGAHGAYRERCAAIRRLPDNMTRLLLFLQRRPWLRRTAFRALGRRPGLFKEFLAVHSRCAPPSSLARRAPEMALLLGKEILAGRSRD